MPDLFGEPTGGVVRSAVLSECGRYRYRLSRVWDATRRPALFIALNPSTADAAVDDPTIRRMVGFARAWGAGGVDVVNLFAWRATDPVELRLAGDKVGPDNDRHVRAAAGQCRPVVAAWGAHGRRCGRDRAVARILAEAGVPVWCLGVTASGAPRHPLYVRGDTPLVPFAPGGG